MPPSAFLRVYSSASILKRKGPEWSDMLRILH